MLAQRPQFSYRLLFTATQAASASLIRMEYPPNALSKNVLAFRTNIVVASIEISG